MRRLRKLIWLGLVGLVVGVKLDFWISEGVMIKNGVYLIDAVVTVVLAVAALVGVCRGKEKEGKKGKINGYGWVFLGLIGVCLGLTFNYNRQKVVVTGWDAIAMYDGRAKYRALGATYQQLAKVAPYDDLHRNFYLSYPPMTSTIHYYWEKWWPRVPVGLAQTGWAALLVIVVVMTMAEIVGVNMALVIAFMAIANPISFAVTLVEYSNMLFSVYLVAGVMMLVRYIKEKEGWMLALAAILLEGTMWIRFAEPVWLMAVLAWGWEMWNLGRRREIGRYILVWLGLGWSWWAWKVFAGSNMWQALSPSGNLAVGALKGLESGLGMRVAWSVLKNWGGLLGVLGMAGLMGIFKSGWMRMVAKLIGLSVVMYTAGMYVLAVGYTWWEDVVRDSLLRSSVALLPVALLILGTWFKDESRSKV